MIMVAATVVGASGATEIAATLVSTSLRQALRANILGDLLTLGRTTLLLVVSLHLILLSPMNACLQRLV